MKNYIIKGLLILCLGFVASCGKKFLEIDQIDRLTGNNYWKTKAEVEQFANGIYSTFRSATMNQIFFPATGDFRTAPIVRSSSSDNSARNYLLFLRTNALNSIFAQHLNPVREFGDSNDYFGFHQIRKWDHFFQMVSNANILYYQLEQMPPGALSDVERKRYKAEAVFLRNLAYFFMVRVFGDVPYYTNAFNTTALGRTNMVTVLMNAQQDMESHYKDLPWTFDDKSIVAVRAMRGSAIALMMHMNMWIAGFTTGDKTIYYQKTADLGKELMEENEGAYQLLPLSKTKEIFKGRTKEGLFEIVQNFNYGETFHLSATYSDYVLRFPNKVTTNSYISYTPTFMEKMYPPAAADLRKTYWFDEFIYDTGGKFQCLKFLNVFMEEGEDNNPDDNQMVFRYADAILLRAEALAELNQDAEAKTVVNIVRDRAGAIGFTSNGEDLKEEIWWERVRELLGEGHFFYDLVRTKKVLNSKYTGYPISVDAFNRGGWTWPLDAGVLLNNPHMTLNNYWN